jgi:hypothetical protein
MRRRVKAPLEALREGRRGGRGSFFVAARKKNAVILSLSKNLKYHPGVIRLHYNPAPNTMKLWQRE